MQNILIAIYYLVVLVLNFSVAESLLRRAQVAFYVTQFLLAATNFIAITYFNTTDGRGLPSLYFLLLSLVGLFSCFASRDKNIAVRYHRVAAPLIYFGFYLVTQISLIESALMGLSSILLAEIIYRLGDHRKISAVELGSLIVKYGMGSFVCIAAFTAISPIVILFVILLWILMSNLHWENHDRIENYLASLLLPSSLLVVLYERFNSFLNNSGVISNLLTGDGESAHRTLYALYSLEVFQSQWFTISWFFSLLLLVFYTVGLIARTTEKKPLFRISTGFSLLLFLLSVGLYRPEFLFVSALTLLYLAVCRLLASVVGTRWWFAPVMALSVPGTLFGFIVLSLGHDVSRALWVFDWQSQFDLVSFLPLLGLFCGLMLFTLFQPLIVGALVDTKTLSTTRRGPVVSFIYFIPLLLLNLLVLPFTVVFLTGFEVFQWFDSRWVLVRSSPTIRLLFASCNNPTNLFSTIAILVLIAVFQVAVLYLGEKKKFNVLTSLKQICAHMDLFSGLERLISKGSAILFQLVVRTTPKSITTINKYIKFIIYELPCEVFSKWHQSVFRLNDIIFTRKVYAFAYFCTQQCTQTVACYWKRFQWQKLKSNDETTIGWALFLTILFILGVVVWA